MRGKLMIAARTLVMICAISFTISCAGLGDRKIRDAVEQLNSFCPQRLDEVTTIEAVEMGEAPREIVMRHTVDISRNDENFDYDTFQAMMKNFLQERMKSQDMEPLRKLDATVTFVYADEDAEELLHYSVTPQMYK